MAELEIEVAALERLDLFALREQWTALFGPPPRFRSVELFRLMLAWRLQASAAGGLDAHTKKMLRASGPVVAEGQELGIGATLTRQWQGENVTVEVVEGGFRWNGQTFRSLSGAATAITGSRWNGPKFFGLRP